VLGFLWPAEWFRGGQRSRWRRGRVSDAGCVPGRSWWLGEQFFGSPFYLCKSRETERGYACLQGFYHDSPHLRLLIPDVRFHREGAVPRRNGAARVLCIHASRPRVGGALHESRSLSTPGRSGPVARQRSTLEDFFKRERTHYLDRYQFAGKSVEFGEKD
jgi:hypothetical protein